MDGFAPTTDPGVADAVQTGLASAPATTRTDQRPGLEPARRVWRRMWQLWRPFVLTVVLPTLIVAGYYYLIAARQYQSEAHFIVKTNETSPGPTSGLGQALGLTGSNPGMTESHSIGDYLISHDAVAALRRTIDLPAVFTRPEADLISRLWPAKPTPETLLEFFRRQVKIVYATDSGISTLTVRAFRPGDAHAIAETLLRLGEARVNSFNQRALEDSVGVAKAQLREAEDGVAAAQLNLTGLRQRRGDIDPEHSSTAQITLASSLAQQLALSRAQLGAVSASVGPDSPQRIALAQQVQALQTQVAAAQAKMAGPVTAMAPNLGAFEELKLRQEFAAKRYETAATALEAAREQALKQQMFVVRVIEPDLPVKALYPQRAKIVATVFCGLLLAYAIGWLILAGVREHAS